MRRIVLAARSAAPKIPQARLLSSVSPPAPVETVPDVIEPFSSLDLHTYATEKSLIGKNPPSLFAHQIDNLRENLAEHIHPVEAQALEEIQNGGRMSPETARNLLAAVDAGEVPKGIAFSLFSVSRARVQETWLPEDYVSTPVPIPFDWAFYGVLCVAGSFWIGFYPAYQSMVNFE